MRSFTYTPFISDGSSRFAGFVAASPLLRGQEDPFRNHSRAPGINELTTAFDFDDSPLKRYLPAPIIKRCPAFEPTRNST